MYARGRGPQETKGWNSLIYEKLLGVSRANAENHVCDRERIMRAARERPPPPHPTPLVNPRTDQLRCRLLKNPIKRRPTHAVVQVPSDCVFANFQRPSSQWRGNGFFFWGRRVGFRYFILNEAGVSFNNNFQTSNVYIFF